MNFLKPPGMTSAQAVGFVKRITKAKVGHAGTLDPEACGVLPLLFGKATKIFDYLTDKEKSYLAEIAFGIATDTQDAQGRVIQSSKCYPGREEVQLILKDYIGAIKQTPPCFSALKINGKPAYQFARQGADFEIAARDTAVENIEIIRQLSQQSFLLRVRCGKGTYIRTLCHDIGQALQCPAHMRFLVREKSGIFHIQDAVRVEELSAFQNGALPWQPDWLITMDWLLRDLPAFDIPDSLKSLALNGAKLPVQVISQTLSLRENTLVRLYLEGHLHALYHVEGAMFRLKTMLSERGNE